MASIHSPQIKQLHYRPRIGQLGRIIRRRSKLLEDLPPDASGGLLHLDHGAVSEVALNKEHHLIVPHQGLVAADVVEPSLHEGLDATLVLLGSSAGGCEGGRDGRNEGFGIGGYEVFGELDEFGVETADVAILRGAESGEVGLE